MNDMWSTLILHSLKFFKKLFKLREPSFKYTKKESKDITERVKGNGIKL